MFGGIAAGYFLRRFSALQKLSVPIYGTILFLLFLMGVHIGANEGIIRSLSTLGWQALLISSACTLGSLIAAKFVYSFWFKGSIEK